MHQFGLEPKNTELAWEIVEYIRPRLVFLPLGHALGVVLLRWRPQLAGLLHVGRSVLRVFHGEFHSGSRGVEASLKDRSGMWNADGTSIVGLWRWNVRYERRDRNARRYTVEVYVSTLNWEALS